MATQEQLDELCLSPKKNRKAIDHEKQEGEDDDDLDSLSSWHFDLGPLAPSQKEEEDNEAAPKHQAPPTSVACSTEHHDKEATKSRATAGTELSSEFDTDVDDMTSLSEEMEGANLEFSKDHKPRSSLNASTNTFSDMSMSINSHLSNSSNSFWGDIESMGEEDLEEKNNYDREDGGHHQHHRHQHSRTGDQRKKQDEQQKLLEQRRAARELRMKKVRERIDREKKQAEKDKKKAAKRDEKHKASKEVRTKRAYEWYCRLGMVSRKELKRRCRAELSLGVAIDIEVEDVDLLPWNSTGTYVNVTKMPLLGAGLDTGNTNTKNHHRHKRHGERLAI